MKFIKKIFGKKIVKEIKPIKVKPIDKPTDINTWDNETKELKEENKKNDELNKEIKKSTYISPSKNDMEREHMSDWNKDIKKRDMYKTPGVDEVDYY